MRKMHVCCVQGPGLCSAFVKLVMEQSTCSSVTMLYSNVTIHYLSVTIIKSSVTTLFGSYLRIRLSTELRATLLPTAGTFVIIPGAVKGPGCDATASATQDVCLGSSDTSGVPRMSTPSRADVVTERTRDATPVTADADAVVIVCGEFDNAASDDLEQVVVVPDLG